MPRMASCEPSAPGRYAAYADQGRLGAAISRLLQLSSGEVPKPCLKPHVGCERQCEASSQPFRPLLGLVRSQPRRLFNATAAEDLVVKQDDKQGK